MTGPPAQTDRRRWPRRLAVVGAILFLLLGGAVVLVPLLVDSAAVRAAIEREVSRRVGGKVRYDSIGLRLFPIPRAEIRGISFHDPDLATARAALLRVKLSLATLLTGRVRPTAIQVEELLLEVRLGQSSAGAGDPLVAYREWAGPIVDGLVREAAGLAIEIADGRVDFTREGQRVVALSKLTIQGTVDAQAIDLRVSSAADRWRSAEGRLRIVPGSLAASGRLQMSGLDVREQLAVLETAGGLTVRPAPLDVRFEAETDGRATLHATIDATTRQLALERGPRLLEIGATRLVSEVTRDTNTLAVSVRHLTLGDLVPATTGTLRARADGGAPELKLSVTGVDLARLRDATLTLAGDVDAVRAATDIVRAGTLRSLGIESSGNTFAALADGIRLTSIEVEQPAFEVRLGPVGGRGTREPILGYRESLQPIVDRLVRNALGLSGRIIDGHLDVLRDGGPMLALSKLEIEAAVGADAIEVHANGVADRWRAAEAHVRLVPESLAGSARLEVSGLDATGLLTALDAAAGLTVRPGPVDARLEAATDGRAALRATIDTATPQLVLERGTRRLNLGATRLAAEVTRDASTLAVSLRRLQVGDLLPGATGALRARPDGTAPTLDLQVPMLDLARLRRGALALAPDVAGVRAAAEVVQGGVLRMLKVASSGRSLATLTEVRQARAAAELTAASVALADLGIEVGGGKGLLGLADGVLTGRELSGTIGRSSFHDGALALEIASSVSVRRLRASIDADLGEVLTFARRTLAPADASTLADVESLQGRATGSLAIEGESDRKPEYRIDLTRLLASGRYRGVPFPLTVAAGEVRYAPGAVQVGGLSGTVGRSKITGAAADITLGSPGRVRAAGARAVLELDELYPWLASLDRLRPTLKNVKSLTGAVDLHLVRASGPLASPEYEAAIEPHEARAVMTELPAPLVLNGGEARITHDTLRLDRVQAALLDARATLSGSVDSYASPDRRLDLDLSAGVVGPSALDWLRTRWKVEPDAMPRPPVVVDSGRLRWAATESSEHSAQGTFRLAGDARAEIDLAWTPTVVDVRRFSLKDADSDVSGSIRLTSYRASLTYTGRIDHRSIVRIMAQPPDTATRLTGNLRAEIDLLEPRRSTATGTLLGEGLEVLERWGLPGSIERLRVDAAGKSVSIREARVKVAGQRVAVAGSVAIRPRTFAVDLQAEANRIDAGQIHTALAREDGSYGSKAGWDVPVEGQVAIVAKSIAFAGHSLASVVGTVRFEPKRAVVELSKATLCSVAVPAKAVLTPDGVSITGRIVARDAGLDAVLPCVFPGLAATGRVDLDAEYGTSDPPGALVQRLSASFRGRGRAGRIHYGALTPRILALEGVSERMKANETEEAIARGLAFRELAFVGSLDAGNARIERLTLDSRALGVGMTGTIDLVEGELALRGVAAPFGTTTALVRRIPVVGRLFGARVFGIPFSVSGDWHDPRVIPLGPEAIAGSLIDFLGQAVRAPIELLNPLLPTRDRVP